MRLWQLAQTGLARCWVSISRTVFGVSAEACFSSAGTSAGGGGGGVPRIDSRIQAPRSTGLVRYGYDETARTAGIPSRPPRVEPCRQVEPLRLLPSPVTLMVSPMMPRQLAGQHGLRGIDQVQQREIALEDLVEEEGGLKPDIGADLLIGGPCGEQLGVGRLVGVELADAQPLIDETLGELERLLAAQHARDAARGPRRDRGACRRRR